MPTPEPVTTRSPKRPVVLEGSASHARAEIALSQPIDPSQVITFAVHLRENPNVNAGLVRLASEPVNRRRFLTDANFDPTKTAGADYYGADPADVKTVTDWVDTVNAGIADPAKRLSISSVEYDIHAVKISATAGQVSSLFKVDLRQWKQDDGTLTMGHTQDATVPAALAGVARGVIGFNTLGHFDPLYRRPDWWDENSTFEPEPRVAVLRPVARATRRVVDSARRMFGAMLPGRPSYPDQLATFYGMPALGAEQVREPRIAILEYGGRTSQQALDGMAQRRGVAKALVPRIERYYVGGIAQNFDSDANVECDLDAQVISVGLGSKGIRHSLVEVNALDTEMGAGDAVAWAARDQGNPLGGAGADIASESWGDPKWNWTPYAVAYRRSANRFALLKGVPVLVASGDNGSRDTTANVTVDYYSGDDLNLGVGGTHSWTDAAGKHELTWGGPQMSGATGGGVDPDVPTPYYQRKVGITPVTADTGKPGAGNPDVAANASPNSGAIILTGDDAKGNGAGLQPIGGTSEAAPHWASFLGVAVALSGNRIGPPHGLLYAAWQQDQKLPAAQRVFRDITQGTNGDYDAAPGWDATTGLGSPADVGRLARTLIGIQPVAPDVQFSLSDAAPKPAHFPGLAA
jgi:kumamolisin